MSRPLPEIELARRLLRDVAPTAGSKERVYFRLRSSPKSPSRLEFRLAAVVACLLVTTTAMGIGVRWVAREMSLPAVASPSVRKPAVSAPQQTKKTGNSGAQLVPSAESLSASAANSPELEGPPQANALRAKVESTPRTIVGSASLASADARSNPSRPEAALASNRRNLGSVASLADVSDESLPSAKTPSELSQQVAEYHAAVDGLRVNPGFALVRLNAFRVHWPKSSIMYEVDLRIVEALVKLGRRGEAADSARAFVHRYPGSPRAAEMHRIAGTNAGE